MAGNISSYQSDLMSGFFNATLVSNATFDVVTPILYAAQYDVIPSYSLKYFVFSDGNDNFFASRIITHTEVCGIITFCHVIVPCFSSFSSFAVFTSLLIILSNDDFGLDFTIMKQMLFLHRPTLITLCSFRSSATISLGQLEEQ